jgi:DNA-binding transcriptional MerR regulator
MQQYSTRQAANKLGLSLATLNKYIALKQIPEPPVTRVAGMRVRLWSDEDIERVRKILPKIQNGRKTRHQKKKTQTKRSKPTT